MKAYRVIPWVEISGGLLASVIFLLWFSAGMETFACCGAGVLTLLGWRLAFGTDLTMEEAYASAEGLPAAAAARLLNEATNTLRRIQHLSTVLVDPRLEEIASQSNAILYQLRQEPSKLAASSRFLQIYLDGVATVGEKFAALPNKAPERIASFGAFLDEVEATCAAQQKAITADATYDLDAEINVLTRRMRAEPTYEGVPHVNDSSRHIV